MFTHVMYVLYKCLSACDYRIGSFLDFTGFLKSKSNIGDKENW